MDFYLYLIYLMRRKRNVWLPVCWSIQCSGICWLGILTERGGEEGRKGVLPDTFHAHFSRLLSYQFKL